MALGDGSSWDETNPQQSTLANTLDSYDRDVRIGVRGRMALEHEWPSSQSVTSAAGYHKFITLQNQASKPTISGTQLAAIYSKTVGSGLQEMFWENEAGTEVQITNRGGAPGKVVSLVCASTNGLITIATTMPYGASAPTTAHGGVVISTAITLQATSNFLEVTALAYVANANDNSVLSLALYQGTTSPAIAIGACKVGNIFDMAPIPIPIFYRVAIVTTGSITYTLRAGCDNASNTTYVNGATGVQAGGGTMYSSIKLSEVAP